jgi:hypothetical protein
MNNKTPKKPSGNNTETNIDGDISKSIFVAGNGNVVTVSGGWTLIIAVISIIVIIIAALLFFHLFGGFLGIGTNAGPTSSATLPESSLATEVSTGMPIVVEGTSIEVSPIASPVLTPAPMSENAVIPSNTPEQDARMTVVLQVSDDDGKAPLNVNFDARASFITFADGRTSTCGTNRFCSYNFSVYCSGECVESIGNNDGVFSYTFGAKGTYFVAVYVCRGDVCEDDGMTITVR